MLVSAAVSSQHEVEKENNENFFKRLLSRPRRQGTQSYKDRMARRSKRSGDDRQETKRNKS